MGKTLANQNYIRGFNAGDMRMYFSYPVEITEIYIESSVDSDRLKGKAKIPTTSLLGEYCNQSTNEVDIQIFDYDKELIGSRMYADWKAEVDSIKNEMKNLPYLESDSEVLGFAKLKVCGRDDGFMHISIGDSVCEKIIELIKNNKLSGIKLTVIFYNIFSIVDDSKQDGEEKFIINNEEFRHGETVGAVTEIKIVGNVTKLDSVG